MKMQPRVTDNDKGEISVSLEGKELRGWSYADDSERRQKMLMAREYVEGWCDGQEAKTMMDGITELTGSLKRHPGGHNWPDMELVIDSAQVEIEDNGIY